MKIVIGIDCAPGRTRPNAYIGGALRILGIDNKENLEKEAFSKLFGAWEWEFDCNEETYQSKRDELQKYFEDLYERGFIRGAQFNKIA